MEKRSNENIAPNTYHNFNLENKIILLVGGFTMLKKPTVYFVCNLFVLACLLSLYIFLMSMAITTVIMVPEEKVTMARAIQAFCALLCGKMMPFVKYVTGENLEKAMNMIKNGVYKYVEEDTEEMYLEIVKNRVNQIRYLDSAITKMFLLSALGNGFGLPLIEFCIGDKTNADKVVNPYLPLPLYMPFNTRTVTGFGIAFLSHLIFITISYTTIICTITTYLSCSLQLVAQLEILNKSLMSLEKRACSRLLKTMLQNERTPPEALKDMLEFQKCLYFCLRENVRHHQTILRLKEYINPYTEGTNFMCMLLVSIFMAASIMAVIESSGFNVVVIIPIMVFSQFCYLQMSALGQDITDKSTEIKDSLYSSPWTIANRPFNLLLKIMIINTQKPIILKTPGFNKDVSLSTYGDVVTTGYKLINVLR